MASRSKNDRYVPGISKGTALAGWWRGRENGGGVQGRVTGGGRGVCGCV